MSVFIWYILSFDSLIHLQDSQTRAGLFSCLFSLIHLLTYKTLKPLRYDDFFFTSLIHLFTYKTLKPSVTIASEFSPFDSLIHLQDSQTLWNSFKYQNVFDSLIHLQDSQTHNPDSKSSVCLIHLFTYKTLKLTYLRK